ncbi:MAG: cytochrome c1 [Rhodospirillales bacterium]
MTALRFRARVQVRARARARVLCAAAALAAGVAVAAAPGAFAAGDGPKPPPQAWSSDGPFGTFDRAALRRGMQVYQEVCASCHSLDLVAFRHLGQIGFSADEQNAVAAEYDIIDGPNDDGDMFERSGKPFDYFPAPFENDKAAAAANGGAAPPDLSLIVKGRQHGADYIYALLTGYADPPAGFDLQEGANYNTYYRGQQIAMAAPLLDDIVEFADGTPATVDQMARDVTEFLHWTSEPDLEDRKGLGLAVLIFLGVFTVLALLWKRRIWSDLH